MNQEDDEVRTMQAEALRLETARAEGEGASAPLGEASGVDVPVLEALGRGDKREALRLCVREHGEAVGRLCMALLGSQADAQDVLQETLLDAYRGLEGFRAQGTVRGWLCGIARRKCARELERGQRRRAKLRAVEPVEAGPSAEQLLGRRRQAERAREALAGLRPSEREALVLRFGTGLSFREVGQACGIEEAAARKRVSRALGALRSELTAEE